MFGSPWLLLFGCACLLGAWLLRRSELRQRRHDSAWLRRWLYGDRDNDEG